jgi:nuclear pore complex protein Nup54
MAIDSVGSALGAADKRAPPNSPTLEPATSVNPNHPAVLGLSGATKKKPPPLGGFGTSTATANGTPGTGTGTGTGSFFGGATMTSPGAVGTSANTTSFPGLGTSNTSTSNPTSGPGSGSSLLGGQGFGSGFGTSTSTPSQPQTTGLGLGTQTQSTQNAFGSGTSTLAGNTFGSSNFGGGFGLGQSQQQPQPLSQSALGQSTLQPPVPQLQPGHQTLPSSFTSSISSSSLPSKPSIFGDFGATLRSKNPNEQTQGPSNLNYGPAQPPSIENQLSLLKQKWDPTSPECIFQTYFYNRVGADQAALYTKPANHDQKKWDEAVSARPDNTVVPVLAVGFPALKERRQVQEQQVLTYRARMHEIVGKLSELQKSHDLTTAPKIETARDKLITLSHRTLRLAAKVQVLKSRGYALRPEEEVLKERLVSLERDLRDPDSFGRVGEIWARLGAVKQRLALLSRSETTGIDWSDEATAEMVAKVHAFQS